MGEIVRTFAQMKEPYKGLVKYFGVYNLDLSLNEDSDWMDDQDFTFPLIIGKDRIAELLRKDMDLVLDGDDPVLDLLWLNANLNFSDFNEQAQQAAMDEFGGNEDELAWPSIREDLLRLAAFFRSGGFDYKAIQIKSGKGRGCEIQNYMGWFSRVFEKQCFEKVFGKISDEQIKAELDAIDEQKEAAKKRLEQERREKRKKVKAIACGLSDLFMERGLITVPANVKLLYFASDYLYEMEYITQDEHDSPFFTETIRAWINGSRDRRPRLDTLPPARRCTWEDLQPTGNDEQRKRLINLAFPSSK